MITALLPVRRHTYNSAVNRKLLVLWDLEMFSKPWRSLCWLLLGPLHTYPDILETEIFFLRFQKISNRFCPSTWKQHSIPYGACVMLEVNDVRHHRIRKPPVSSVHTQTKSRRFQKSLLSRAFLKRSVFSDSFCRTRVDGRPKPKKKYQFWNKNGHEWTRRGLELHYVGV